AGRSDLRNGDGQARVLREEPGEFDRGHSFLRTAGHGGTAADDATSLGATCQEMPGQGSGRTLAECSRLGHRTELDARGRLPADRSLGHRDWPHEMGTYWLALGRHILSDDDRWRNLVESKRSASACDVFSRPSAVPGDRPCSVPRRTCADV